MYGGSGRAGGTWRSTGPDGATGPRGRAAPVAAGTGPPAAGVIAPPPPPSEPPPSPLTGRPRAWRRERVRWSRCSGISVTDVLFDRAFVPASSSVPDHGCPGPRPDDINDGHHRSPARVG